MNATIHTVAACSGLHSAVVDIGDGGRVFPGYLDAADALEAGRRFARAMGADPGATGKHGTDRRSVRRMVRAVKHAWLNSEGA